MGFSLFGKNKQSASDTDTEGLEGKAAPRRRKKNAEQPVDPVLPEKKRARRRLVGAAAMVLAAIIGLPMLLESEPQPLADDIRIHIPAIDKAPVDTRVASLSDEEQAAPLVPVSDEIKPQETKPQETKPQEPATKPSAPAPSPAPAPASSAKAAPADKAEKPKADKSPVASAPTAPAAKTETPKTTQSASSTESERAAQVRALLEGKNTPAASTAKASADNKADNKADTKADAKQGKFALQVAALGSVEKAKELQGRLSKAGITSYTEKVKVSGSEQIRVRVGPFASREEADRMRGKLSDLGLNGMVMPL